MMQYPKAIKAGTKIEQIAGAIDLLPTLADLAGIKHQSSKPLDGISLKPLLLKNTQNWPNRLLFSHWGGRISVRSQQHRLDHTGKLYDMVADPSQTINVAAQNLTLSSQLQKEIDAWKKEVLIGISEDKRTFPVGHIAYKYTQLPARDAQPQGGIKRSNKYPNATFMTHWTSINDAIVWEIEVLEEGDFEVELYYTCPANDVGSTFQLSFNQQTLTAQITEAHDPPLRGMEHDRFPRMESYIKDFKPLKIGTIHLEKGIGKLMLKATDIAGKQVMDFRLLMLERVR
ncbi:MAG: hypothetical protein R2822_31020 [Spirosomataceae bacterium]